MAVHSAYSEVPDREGRGSTSFFRMPFARLNARWNESSLAFQFFAAGGLVALLAMLLIGAVVTDLIERTATRNAAAATALYVDSVIAPLLPDMRRHDPLDDVVKRALDETLGQGALGSRLAAMRLWAPDGTVLYAEDESLIGRRFPTTEDLDRAFSGRMVANYDRFDQFDASSEVPPGPLLEIYNPILQPWSGDVVAVIEFHERARNFEATLETARLRSWLAVSGATALLFLPLSLIVFRGSRTIDRQARDLNARVGELTGLLEQNRALHLRVQRATRRATSLNESYLRRLGADLHDGPAQFVAFAALRLDSPTVLAADTPPETRERELQDVHACLQEALGEIRNICHGLVLPEVETAELAEVVARAIDAYERRTGMKVERRLEAVEVHVPVSQRICIYRFLQEALNNGYRHCRGARQVVTMERTGGALSLTVADDGPGFDAAGIGPDSIGIAGIRERVESLGGRFRLDSSAAGTTLEMQLDFGETDGK